MKERKTQYQHCIIVFSSMRLWLVFLLCVFIKPAFSQPEKTWNYKRYDERTLHFGFMLGLNSSDFTTYTVMNAYETYGLKSLVSKSQPGGQVGIVSSLKLWTPVVRLRFLPSLSFQERVLNYTFENPDPDDPDDKLNEERVNSTNLDFPLMFQFRTLRYNNFASYLLVGAQYTMDLQSQEEASQNFIDPFIKIKKHDLHGQIGGGVEFFAPYFKFGIEVKFSHSFYNSLIQDLTPVSKPIDALYNRVWWLSFIFEG